MIFENYLIFVGISTTDYVRVHQGTVAPVHTDLYHVGNKDKKSNTTPRMQQIIYGLTVRSCNSRSTDYMIWIHIIWF